MATMTVPPGPQTATIEFRDPSGNVVSGLTKTVHFTAPAEGKIQVLFVSDKSSTPQTL
jgi:hypothetical protein